MNEFKFRIIELDEPHFIAKEGIEGVLYGMENGIALPDITYTLLYERANLESLTGLTEKEIWQGGQMDLDIAVYKNRKIEIGVSVYYMYDAKNGGHVYCSTAENEELKLNFTEDEKEDILTEVQYALERNERHLQKEIRETSKDYYHTLLNGCEEDDKINKEQIIRELECITDLTRFDPFTGEDYAWLPKEAEEVCLVCEETCALLMGKPESSIPINHMIEVLEAQAEGFERSISERAAFMAEQGIEHENVQDLEIGNLKGIKGAIAFLQGESLKQTKRNDMIER